MSVVSLVLGMAAWTLLKPGECSAQQQDEAGELADPAARIASLIEVLADDRFSVRERAEKELVSLGIVAAEPLLHEVIAGEPESAVRCGRILEKVALEARDERDVNRIGLILHVLSENGRPWFRGTAASLRAGWQAQRRQRMIGAIEDLGVNVETDPANYRLVLPPRVRLGIDVSSEGSVETATTVEKDRDAPRPLTPMLDDEQLNAELTAILTASDSAVNQRMEEVAIATGGEPVRDRYGQDHFTDPLAPLAADPFRNDLVFLDGVQMVDAPIVLSVSRDLEKLHRVAELANETASDIYLHLDEGTVDDKVIDGLEKFQRLRSLQLSRCRYDAAKMLDFAATHPDVKFTSVGHDAFLGIATTESRVEVFEGFTTACRIITVVGESAAEQAGMRVGEYVLALDGIEVTEFDEMIVIIASHKLGDRLRVRVGSPETGDIRELEITLRARPPGS